MIATVFHQVNNRNKVTLFFGILSVVFGCVGLLGWFLNEPLLKSLVPNSVSMKVNTAIAFILMGISVSLVPYHDIYLKIIKFTSIFLTITLCVFHLSEMCLEINFGIDQLLFTDDSTLGYPGRMSPIAAILFILLSIGLLAKNVYHNILSQMCIVISLLSSILIFVGYLYGAKELYTVGNFTPIALPTAIIMFILSLGALSSCPNKSLVGLFIDISPGGRMVRRLSPPGILLPIILGFLNLLGCRIGLYGIELGVSIFAVSNIVIFLFLVFITAYDLKKFHDINEELNDANKELYNFALIAAHDLQDPLKQNAVYIKMIENGKTELIQEMKKNNSRMLTFISKLLTFSKSGKNLDIKLTSVDSIVKNVLIDLEVLIKSSNAKITICCDMPMIRCDPIHLGRVFHNLIKNAINYSKIPVVEINSVSMKDYWMFSVKDNGVGMSQSQLDTLFTIHRSHNAMDGTGFGLPICKRIVEGHQGTIRVESRMNEGTCFFFTIAKNL